MAAASIAHYRGTVIDDELARLNRERKAADAALNKAKLPSRKVILTLGRLVEIGEAEARLAEIDQAIAKLARESSLPPDPA